MQRYQAKTALPMQQAALTAQVNKENSSIPLSFFFLLKIEFKMIP